jgi:hypothetical protein
MQGRGIHVTGGNRNNWEKLNLNYAARNNYKYY